MKRCQRSDLGWLRVDDPLSDGHCQWKKLTEKKQGDKEKITKQTQRFGMHRSTGGVVSGIRAVCVSSGVNSDSLRRHLQLSSWLLSPDRDSGVWCHLSCPHWSGQWTPLGEGGKHIIYKPGWPEVHLHWGLTAGSAPDHYYKWPGVPLWRPSPQGGLSDLTCRAVRSSLGQPRAPCYGQGEGTGSFFWARKDLVPAF